MAPALTDAGQSQNFKLSSGHSIPASPSKVDINGLEVNENEEYLSLDGHQLIKSDVNIESLCVNGTSKILKEKPSFANLKPSRPRFVIPADSYAVTKNLESSEGVVTSSDSGLVKNGGFMMSSDPSVGDNDGNMGLQKSNSGMMPTLGTGSYLKENFFPSMDMDQLLKSFTATDLVSGGDITHNMDDVLQLIKNMESNAELTEDIGNVDAVESGESDAMFPIAEGADLTSSLTNFEREILNEVELNMCVDVNLAEGNLPSKQTLFDQKLEEVRKKQFEVERRCEFLLRRLRKLQAKGMGKHASEEITGLLNYTQNLIQEVSSGGPVTEPDPKQQKRAVATMLQQLDTSAHSSCAVKLPASGKYFGSGSSDHVPVITSGLTLPQLSSETKEDIERVSGQLYTQLHMVESAVDSDVTASSSGGESCDEMVSYNNQHQQPLSITKRAAWKWAQDRAGVASRWIWLQAHISDLEYRIRQHTEIHRQIRLTKGGVTLGGSSPTPESPTPSNGADPLMANGYKDPESMGATGTCRTRPFVRTDYRKRKLLHTAGLHLVSKKAARSSTVRCGCRLPLASCALCTGRSDPTHPREQPDLLTVPERIALLDPSFHPVLSFPSDVSQSTHLDAIMRTPEWQHRMQRSGHKLLKHVGKIERDLMHQEERSKKHVEHRRKYTSRLKKNSANPLTASVQKIKKKLSRGRKPKGHHDADNLHRLKRKHKVKNNSTSLSGYEDEQNEDLRVDVGSLGGGITSQSSPAPSPCPFTSERSHNFVQERNEALRRKRENSYDIDNIVIPYSIASSTRVEKLQYKEILTPKWRIVETEPALDLKNNGIVRRSSHESDVEDVSDEAVIQRHERCEMDEKKRFMAYVKNPQSGRPRIHRRTDSRAGSSGANTPDPMSPNNPAEQGVDVPVASPVTSPPATPLAAVADNEVPSGAPSLGTAASGTAPSGTAPWGTAASGTAPTGIPSRRRTTSQVRLMRDEQRPSTPDYFDEVAPYEPRVFPLSDEEYDRMLKSMPEGHQVMSFSSREHSNDGQELNNISDSNLNNYELVDSLPASPSTDTDTDSAVGEDPNDPEWTGESVKR